MELTHRIMPVLAKIKVLLSTSPFPVGIRFRMCSQATTAGVMIT